MQWSRFGNSIVVRKGSSAAQAVLQAVAAGWINAVEKEGQPQGTNQGQIRFVMVNDDVDSSSTSQFCQDNISPFPSASEWIERLVTSHSYMNRLR
jgi:hypothetical protein